MFGGYHSGEDSSPEPDCLDHCKDGVACSHPVHQEPESIDLNTRPGPDSADSLSFPAKNLSLHKMPLHFGALRLKVDGFRSSHPPSNSRDIFPLPSLKLRGVPVEHDEPSWTSLDKLFLNAEAMKFSEILGKEHDSQESSNTLPTMRLLAITAALVWAARQRDTEKIKHLQQALEDRDRESALLHDKIRELQEHLSFWKERVIPFCRKVETAQPIDQNLGFNESTPKCDSIILEQFATPQVLQRIERNTKETSGFRKYSRVDSLRNGDLQVEDLGTTTKWNKCALTVSGRPLFLDRLSESPVQFAADEKSESLTSHPSNQSSEISASESAASGFVHNQGLVKEFLVNDIPSVMDALSLVKEKVQIFHDVCIVNSLSASDTKAALDFKQSMHHALNQIISVESLMHNIGDSLELMNGSKISASSDRTQENVHMKAMETEGDQFINEEEELFCRRDRCHNRVNTGINSSNHWQDSLIECFIGHQSDGHRSPKLVVEHQELSTVCLDTSPLLEDSIEDVHKLDTDSLNEAFEDVHKTLTMCIEDCNTKDKKISSLEEEINVLHGIVSDLRTLQVNQVTGQADPSSLQTFVTSNVLFNLDSPVEVETTDMLIDTLSPWKELSKQTDSLELLFPTEIIEKAGTANDFADIEKSESSPELSMITNHRRKERRARLSRSRKSESFIELSTVADPRRQGRASKSYSEVHGSCKPGHISDHSAKESKGCDVLGRTQSRQSMTTGSRSSRGSCNIDKVRWSSSSIEQLRMNSGSSSPDESEKVADGYGEIQTSVSRMRIGSPRASPRAKKHRFSSASNNLAEQFDDSSQKGRKRNDKNQGNSVLSGVEPNTPMRPGSKHHKHLNSSVDSLNKAKENMSQRRRWM